MNIFDFLNFSKKADDLINNFEKTSIKTYLVMLKVGLFLATFVAYIFVFNLLLLSTIILTITNILVIAYKNWQEFEEDKKHIRTRQTAFHFNYDWHVTFSLVIATIFLNLYRFGIFSTLSKYYNFLNNLKYFLLQHDISQPYFYTTQFIEELHNFIIFNGYILEVIMLISQLMSIFLFYKTIEAFVYLWVNDKAVALAIYSYDEGEKAKKLNKFAMNVKLNYVKHSWILIVFSIGLPYLFLLFILYVAQQ